MENSLRSQPCGEMCNQEVEYSLNFVITSLVMKDEDNTKGFSNVLIVITWDGNVVKIVNTKGNDVEEFNENMELHIHATPEILSRKLKTCPIMFNLSRDCTELGTESMLITKCFSESILCDDFNSQTTSAEFVFVKENKTNATMNAYIKLEKLPKNEAMHNLYKAFSKSFGKYSKELKRGVKDKKENESDEESDDSCKDFACPEEMLESCKKDIGLQQNIYRIINGNLFNLKDNIGPCGEKCEAARRIKKDLNKSTPEAISLLKFHKCSHDIKHFPCDCRPSCGGFNITPDTKPILKHAEHPNHKRNWIDRNIKEEEILKKLCDKYGINVNEVQGIGEENSRKTNVKKGRKTKKVRNIRKPKIPLPIVEKKPDK